MRHLDKLRDEIYSMRNLIRGLEDPKIKSNPSFKRIMKEKFKELSTKYPVVFEIVYEDSPGYMEHLDYALENATKYHEAKDDAEREKIDNTMQKDIVDKHLKLVPSGSGSGSGSTAK